MDPSGIPPFEFRGLVSIGTHSLFIDVSGPTHRSSTDPIVVVIAGAGDVASSYVAVTRLVSTFAQIAVYDRTGLGRSENGPANHRPNATTAAVELHKLLENANISPPLLLAAHSFGAIIAREYLHLYPKDVAGMVLFEAMTERQSQHVELPDNNVVAVMGDIKYAEAIGLREDAKLSKKEWRARATDVIRGIPAWKAERACSGEVCKVLAEKEQLEKQSLGEKPLIVIRANAALDYQRIFIKGVEAGNGTEEQRKKYQRLLDIWDKIDGEMTAELLRLSTNSRLVHLPDCGQNVHLIRPEIVAEEIRRVNNRIVAVQKHTAGKL